MQHYLFTEILGEGIGVARIDGGGFRRRIDLGDTVAGRGGGVEQLSHALLSSGFGDGIAAIDIGIEIPLRMLNRGHDIGQPSKVEDAVGALEKIYHAAAIADARFDKAEPRICAVLRQVRPAPDGEIIDRHDAPPLSQQRIDEMAADEPRAARHDIERQHDHRTPMPHQSTVRAEGLNMSVCLAGMPPRRKVTWEAATVSRRMTARANPPVRGRRRVCCAGLGEPRDRATDKSRVARTVKRPIWGSPAPPLGLAFSGSAHAHRSRTLAGAGGFEPPYGEIKIPLPKPS